MRRWQFNWWTMGLLVLGAAGCGAAERERGQQPQDSGEPAVSARELLVKPRAELAQRCEDLLTAIRQREADRKRGKLPFALLPDWHAPVVPPIFQEAKYHSDLNVSLPPWADPARVCEDKALAAHFARYGDHDAAQRLSGPGDPPAAPPCATKNYPVEWARLMALEIHGLEQRIATSDAKAVGLLVQLHQELREMFGEERRGHPLARVLLPRGRETVRQAATAWRRRGVSAAAETAEAALRVWPEAEAPTLPGDRRGWESALGASASGPLLVAPTPRRALDLLDQPFPAEMVEDVLLFFDAAGKLEQALVLFGGRAAQNFRRAGRLGPGLWDLAEPASFSDSRCLFQWSALECELVLCPPGGNTGAWARWCVRPAGDRPPLTRALAGIHLNRTFETNRLAAAPQLLGPDIRTSRPATPPLLPDVELQEFRLVPFDDADLVREARWQYLSEAPLGKLAAPLLSVCGLQELALVPADVKKNRLAEVRLRWHDEQTEISLCVPLERRGRVEVCLADRAREGEARERAKAAQAFEREERRARLAAGAPWRRLERRLEQLPLGLPRTDVQKLLPQGPLVARIELDDGLMRAVQGPPLPHARFMVRAMVARFDEQDRLWEVRVRYENGGKPPDRHEAPWPHLLLQGWRAQGGTVSPLPCPRQGRLADLPPQHPAPVFYRWQDDTTVLEATLDRHGVEVVLRERRDEGEARPFVYLRRGPHAAGWEAAVGESWTDVQSRLQAPATRTEDGAYLILPEQGTYDAVLVYAPEGKVQRIVARHRKGRGQAEVQAAFLNQLGRDIREVGWPTRFDHAGGNVLQSAAWLDDAVRMRLWWAESEAEPARVWTEWLAQPAVPR